MGLKEDRRNQLAGGPGIHAFIDGVSDYRHLEDGSDEKRATDTYGFRALHSTARTAWRFYEWLLKADAAGRLALPLATVHLLLSRSESESDVAASDADRCSWANFVADAESWRKCASASNEEITIFYFAGHGIGRQKTEALLLMDDVGAPGSGVFVNRCVDVQQLFYGMAPPPDAAQSVARTQFYFVDACRTQISELREFTTQGIPQIWNVPTDGVDKRAATLFYGSLPGASAYARDEDQTLFSMALFECLDRLGAEEASSGERDLRWRITASSLIRRLPDAVLDISKRFEVDQQCAWTGQSADAIFSYLTDPPETTITMKVDPEQAAGAFQFEVQDYKKKEPPFSIAPIAPHPHQRRMRVG